MKTLYSIALTENQRQALDELQRKLSGKLGIESMRLFGSVVRGEADDESDIDLLIVTTQPLSRTERHQITDIVFEVNLQYNTNFSTLVVDRDSWETGLFSVLPLREEILKDGIAL
jgi:predicted nucleotidyltransferase